MMDLLRAHWWLCWFALVACLGGLGLMVAAAPHPEDSMLWPVYAALALGAGIIASILWLHPYRRTRK